MLIGHVLGNESEEEVDSQGKSGCCNQRRKWTLSHFADRDTKADGVKRLAQSVPPRPLWRDRLCYGKTRHSVSQEDHSSCFTKPRSVCFKINQEIASV